jgi:hypothetical protein
MNPWSAALLVSMVGCAAAFPCFAGKAQKWEDLPKAVQEAVLANGGTAGPVDKESEVKDGKAIYEAQVKDKEGNVKDLVITEDGKLIETKTDDAGDQAAERAERGKKLLAGVKFSHPTKITNPYLPLSNLKQDIIEGTEGGKKTRVERTAKPDLHKTFTVGGQTVEALVVEDRAFVDGQLEEVAIDYFAQDDNGTVYYLGEAVDEYKDGKVINHEGSWLTGKETQVPGVIFPAHPKVGDKFRSEDVSREISEIDEVVSVSETVTVPAGTFKDCIKVKELLGDGKTEYKYYAKGVGVVREVPSDGDELLQSHTTVQQAAPEKQPAVKAAVDPIPRLALSFVGADPVAEFVWATAINDPSRNPEERKDLIEDLNEDGFPDPKHPTADDLPLILSRLDLIEQLGPGAMDEVNADAFAEAYKDLIEMAQKAAK